MRTKESSTKLRGYIIHAYQLGKESVTTNPTTTQLKLQELLRTVQFMFDSEVIARAETVELPRRKRKTPDTLDFGQGSAPQ
jgi:hypothetical protein